MSESSQIEKIDGEVKWFDQRKGFGFIVGPDRQDVFTHFSVIEGEGYRILRDGARVNYSAVRSDKGWRATRVALIGDPAASEPAEITVVPRKTYSRTPRR